MDSQALADAREVLEGQEEVTNAEAEEATTMVTDVKAAMSDDLNTPLVVGAVSPVLKVQPSASRPSPLPSLVITVLVKHGPHVPSLRARLYSLSGTDRALLEREPGLFRGSHTKLIGTVSVPSLT